MSLSAIVASVTAGVLLVLNPIALAPFALLALAVIAFLRPGPAIIVCLVAASLHNGIFLSLRTSAGGVPLSVFDAVPLTLLIAAISLRRGVPASAGTGAVWLRIAIGLATVGIGGGIMVGLANHADVYELLRVIRIEVTLVVGMLATLLAGHVGEWRRAVVAGLMVAAVAVAAQILIAFGWTLVTGTYFWSLFPFGTVVTDVGGAIARANAVAFKENAVSAFFLLPALCLVLVRLRGTLDRVLATVFFAAGAAWLSRGFWVTMLVAIGTVMLFLFMTHRLSLRYVVGALAVMCAVVVFAFSATDNIFQQRVQDATNIGSTKDVSAKVRLAETKAGFAAVAHDVTSFVFGAGAGVVIPRELVFPQDAPTAVLENGLLSKWTNTGLFALLAVTAFFFGAFRHGWRLAMSIRDHRARELGAMALCLPALYLQAFVGGSVAVIQPALALWILAGTVLATPLDE